MLTSVGCVFLIFYFTLIDNLWILPSWIPTPLFSLSPGTFLLLLQHPNPLKKTNQFKRNTPNQTKQEQKQK